MNLINDNMKVNDKVMAFIRMDDRKYEKNYEKVIKIFRKIFGKVKYEKIKDGYVVLIPKYNHYGNIYNKILLNKIQYFQEKNRIDFFIIDEQLKFLMEIAKYEQAIDGKQLMKECVINILEYIFDISEKNMSLEDVYIFVNEYGKSIEKIIKELILRFKTVNVITENLRYYSRLEDKLYQDGVLITVSNNKRKSARKAKYIVNVDFTEEVLQEYNINTKSIIINLNKEKLTFNNRFDGVLVNNIEVEIDKENKNYLNEFYGRINNKIFLESRLKKGQKIEELFSEYNIKIIELEGVRGPLHKCEFLA